MAMTSEADNPRAFAEAGGEVVYLASLINFYGKKAKKFIGDEKVRASSPLMKVKKLRVQYRPYPVVGVISPWNFPLILSLGDAIPALQAGAAVVIKPSEVTPLGLAQIVEAWKREIGGPDIFDVVNAIADVSSERISQASTGANNLTATVWERATVPSTPVRPDPVRNGLLALGLGLMLGMGLVFLLEHLDDSWRSPEEVERVSGIPTFGVIPNFEAAKSRRKGD